LKVENFTKKLTSSQDVVDAINNQQAISNNERERNGLDSIETIPIIHTFLNQMLINTLVVDNLRCYYNFFTDKFFKLSSVVISDLKEPIQIPYEILENVQANKNKKKTSLVENKVVAEIITTEFLASKHLKIKNLLNLKEEYFKKKMPLNK
jgi:hypothetical protein